MTGFIQTYRGNRIFPLAADRAAFGPVEIEDIAHALSNKARFNGHTRAFYSVAEHCYFASLFAETDDTQTRKATIAASLAALLHDAAEAYLPGVASPIKHQFCLTRESNGMVDYLEPFRVVESRAMEFILEALDLQIDTESHVVKSIDDDMLATEALQLINGPVTDWKRFGQPLTGWELRCWLPPVAERKFLERYAYLVQTWRRVNRHQGRKPREGRTDQRREEAVA